MNFVRGGIAALVLGLAISSTTPALAQDVFVGTWVLNAAKSQVLPGAMPTTATVVITDTGDGMYKSGERDHHDGISGRSELTFGIDGKDYKPVTMPPTPGMPDIAQSVEKVSDTVYKTSIKMAGQVIATTLNELSSDGNTLTLTTTGAGQFAALSSTMVFDKK